jgi:predicted  nucleic acid-binding Zn-ribbon protein
MNSQIRGAGLLELVASGDLDATITIEQLIQDGCFEQNMLDALQKILFASIMGFSSLESKIRPLNEAKLRFKEQIEELETGIKRFERQYQLRESEVARIKWNSMNVDLATFKERLKAVESKLKPYEQARRRIHMLAGLAASKIQGLSKEFLDGIHEKLRRGVSDPHTLDANMLDLLAKIEKVMVGQRIVKNGRLIEIAEAAADGLQKTTDPKKINIIQKLGVAVIGRLTDDEERSYVAVFNLAIKPTTSEKSMARIILESVIKKQERGEIRITDSTVSRIRNTLDTKPTPLSDGDGNLPTSHIGKQRRKTLLQRAREILSFGKRKARRLAFAGK